MGDRSTGGLKDRRLRWNDDRMEGLKKYEICLESNLISMSFDEQTLRHKHMYMSLCLPFPAKNEKNLLFYPKKASENRWHVR